MPDLRKGTQQLTLYSQAHTSTYPENTNTCFKNILHSGLRERGGGSLQIQLLGIYSSVNLEHIEVQLDGVKSYFFGSIHRGHHKRLHIGSGSVERHQYFEVKNSTYFDVDLSNLDCWGITIRNTGGEKINPQPGAITVIEMRVEMNPAVEAPKYLYFDNNPLILPSYLNIKSKCFASLLSFSHKNLANVYPPSNQLFIRQDCENKNGISCIETPIVIPTDFYTLEKLVHCLNTKTVKYGFEFKAEKGRLKMQKNGGNNTRLKITNNIAKLFGCGADKGSLCHSDTFDLFDPLVTIPSVLALKCSLLNSNGLNMVEQCLRLIYPNSRDEGDSSYDFEHKQPCLMVSGYVDTVTFKLEAFPNPSTPIYFSKNSETKFSGCLEIQHHTEI